MTSILYKYNINTAQLIRFIMAECLIMVLALATIYYISYRQAMEERMDNCTAAIESSAESFGEFAPSAVIDASEQIKDEVSDTVWITKDNVNYRTGPNVSYALAGTMDEYESVDRVGVTFNEWSLVEIGDEEYYIKSSNLTTEAPFNLDSGTKGDYQRYALSLMEDYGWEDSEIEPLISLWNKESGWNPSAHNGSSGAHGIPQALPASKMASEGSDYYTNGETQIRWGLNYIKGRYGSPSAAWGHFCSRHWY
jgi:uncharacterized protein YgiM (DUF1202 family)